MSGLKKIEVAKGVFWVEARESGLRILCGSPADSVKHLMKRGLIVPTEVGGIRCETGPNAILLSDTLLQNGDFSNLAEFPVLQMLYRQGMGLPDHPNSKEKPLLIGLKEQVQSQLAYIHRGNYGLFDVQEMIEAGASPEEAEQLMAIKTAFAFGKIRPPEAFLDVCLVGPDPVEVGNGLHIRRLRVNVFEFRHGEQTVSVDLNLPAGRQYESPYPLGFHQVPRDYFSVIHSGEGDGWDINRPSMSSVLVFQGRIYLIDAGPNILNTLLALGIGINEVEGIFHTHSHDDHFAGLTSLIRADRRIKYFATPLVRASVAKKFAALVSIDPALFDRFFDVRDLETGVWNAVDGMEAMPVFSPHPVETTLFLFRALWEDGHRTYGHFADTVSLEVLNGIIERAQAHGRLDPGLAKQVAKDYATPTDIKKLDIGGGLIHGVAEDFREDASKKIILAHTALPLNDRQKSIGSGAPFGTFDTLITAYRDYVGHSARQFLRAYFPGAAGHQVEILANNRILSFNPHSIILKVGETPQELFLILSGAVETLNVEGEGRGGLSYAGTLVGEIPGLFQIPSTQTIRTVSFVQALRIPVGLYAGFINLNDLYREVEQLIEVREHLQASWLLGEGISYPVQNEIAQHVRPLHLPAGRDLSGADPGCLHMVAQGKLARHLGEEVFETLERGDFFGEEVAAFKTPAIFSMRTLEGTLIFQIPWERLAEIPIVQWKVFETHEKRKKLILNLELDNQPVFRWREEYSVVVPEMDAHHKMLFEMAGHLARTLEEGISPSVRKEALRFLEEYSRFHFRAEEDLLRGAGYPALDEHLRSHGALEKEIRALGVQVARGKEVDAAVFVETFKSWIVNHILSEDRKYSDFFKQRGV